MRDAYWIFLRLGGAPGWLVWPLTAATVITLGVAGWVAVRKPQAAVLENPPQAPTCGTTQRARRIGRPR